MSNYGVNNGTPEPDILERIILSVVSIVQKNLKLLALAGLLGGILGGVISFIVKEKYKATAQVLPEFKETSFSKFGSLASLAGIDLTNTGESDAVRPDLYPNILQSTPAIVHLLAKPVKGHTTTNSLSLLEYIATEMEIDLDSLTYLKNQKNNDSIPHFNKKEFQVINYLKSTIETNFDKKSGVIVVAIEMPDPLIAAQTLQYTLDYLSNFVSEYRNQKKHSQTVFIRTRVKEADSKLKASEYALQKYRDNNRNIYLNVAKIEEQKLQANYLQAQSLKNDLQNQLEQAIIKEKEEQAILKILEPPIVPNKRSSPIRILYAILGSFIVTLVTGIVLLTRRK